MPHLLVLAALLAAAPLPGSAAAGPRGRDGRNRPEARAPAARARLVAAARAHLARPFPGDCSAFVRTVYSEAAVPLPRSGRGRSGTESIVRALARTRRPRPGDVAYFHRTHDRDPPGRGRNLFTHVGVVESVSGPRVAVIHRSNAGVERLALNLARPRDRRLNGVLRRRRPGDPPGRKVLAGELLGGFASPFRMGRGERAEGAARVSARAP